WNFGNEESVEGAAGPPKSVVPDSGSRPGPDNPPPIPAIPIVTVARNERRCNVASWGSATSPVAYQLGCTRPRPCSAAENGTLFCFERGTLAKQAPGFPIEINGAIEIVLKPRRYSTLRTKTIGKPNRARESTQSARARTHTRRYRPPETGKRPGKLRRTTA